MKTFKLSILFVLLVVCISCSKTEKMNSDYEDVLNQPTTAAAITPVISTSVSVANMVASEQNIVPNDITYCNTKSVTICTKSKPVGMLTVRRGGNNKIYITYALTGSYYLKECNLYTGANNTVPMLRDEANVCAFPYKKTYTANSYVQQYTFVLNNQPDNFTVAAHAYIVKKYGNYYLNEEDAWADGCTGTKITSVNGDDRNNHRGSNAYCADGNGRDDDEVYYSNDCQGGIWATMFPYSGAACPAPPASLPEPDICSFPVVYFFGIHPVYGCVTAWKEPSVMVGGIEYTEAEGRAIAATTINGSGSTKDAKDAFIDVATLKLSYTGYSLSPTIGPEVTNLETWLSTLGKLSPTNLPTGNASTRASITAIENFMKAHQCPDRIE